MFLFSPQLQKYLHFWKIYFFAYEMPGEFFRYY